MNYKKYLLLLFTRSRDYNLGMQKKRLSLAEIES